MRIIVDTLGGDYGVEAAVKGSISAMKDNGNINVVFAGPKQEIEVLIKDSGIETDRYEIIDAPESVTNFDHPSTFFKEKPDSSMAKAIEAIRIREDIDALISAGPTGALLTGTVLRVGRLPGVKRPALISNLPTENGGVSRLLDCGANMDCKPEYLVQFALMADIYAKALGSPSPIVKILNVGVEEGKGDERTKEASALLKRTSLNFQGSIEADHVLKGDADIVVTDGFAGNIFLKSAEEAMTFFGNKLKEALKSNLLTKIGALFELKAINKKIAPIKKSIKACAPLLGAKKLVLKCHGKSDADTFHASILQAYDLVEAKLQENIARAVADLEA